MVIKWWSWFSQNASLGVSNSSEHSCRSNTQLAELVPRIAQNIDSLLRRYEQGSNSNWVALPEDKSETVDTTTVGKTWGRGRGAPAPTRFSVWTIRPAWSI